MPLVTVAMLGLLERERAGAGVRFLFRGYSEILLSFIEVETSTSIHEVFDKNLKVGSTVELEETPRHTDISMPGWFCNPSEERWQE